MLCLGALSGRESASMATLFDMTYLLVYRILVVNRKNTEVKTMFPNPLEDESDAQTEILTAAAGRDVFFPLNFTFLLRACDKETCRSS